MSILYWAVFGLIVGAIAKFVMPGKDPGGIIVTMAIGVAGALIAGFVGQAIGWYGPGQSAGYITSILGAVVLLFLYRQFFAKKA
jgi:uncharacterized membrane protein YeaQ/YmgE (transglycosylase-associated protein family)